MGRVVVLGSVNRDIVINVPHIARPGETVLGSDSKSFPGGKGANQAVAAGRMGAEVALFGAVGGDGHGAAMRDFLAGEGIDLAGLEILPDVPSGIALIAVDAQGQNAITVSPGANARVTIAQAEDLPLTSADILICQFEIPLDVVVAGFRRARAAGACTILNPAPMQAIPPELLAEVDILVLNEVELADLAGHARLDDEPEFIRSISRVIARSCNPDLIVIATLGAQGCIAVAGTERIRVPAERVTPVDTTGAGDCFVGALAAFLIKDAPLADALRLANRAAAIAVTRPGAAASFPMRIEVLKP